MAETTIGILGSGRQRAPKRVTRTGLALVHENEIVYPAAGSAAEAVQAIGEAAGLVQVFFPVQIEIRATGAEEPASNGSDQAADVVDAAARAIDPD